MHAKIAHTYLCKEFTFRRVVVNCQVVYGLVNWVSNAQLSDYVIVVQEIAQRNHGPVVTYSRALLRVVHLLDKLVDNPQVVHPLAPVVSF